MCTAVFFHLVFNYKAVRCLQMNVFNSERFRLSLRAYLPTSSVPTIEQVNRNETVFLGRGTSDFKLCGFTIVFGVCLKQAFIRQKITYSGLSTLVNIFQSKKYFILADLKKKKIYVTFRTAFSENDVLQSYFHSFLIGISISYLQSNDQLVIYLKQIFIFDQFFYFVT